MKKIIYFILLLSVFALAAGPIISGPISGGGGGGVTAETDPIVGAVNGIVVADGAGNITGITSSTDMQAFLGAANDTAARTELGLGSLATQNADNVTVTNFTVSGAVNATGATWTGLTPKFTFVDGSSSANITAIQLSGTVLGNPTQSGNVTHVLPAIEAGLQFDTILGLTAAFYFRLDLMPTTQFILMA